MEERVELSPENRLWFLKVHGEVREYVVEDNRLYYPKAIEVQMNNENRESVLRGRINTYFDELHSSTWGRGYDISKFDTRTQAEDAILELIDKLDLDISRYGRNGDEAYHV